MNAVKSRKGGIKNDRSEWIATDRSEKYGKEWRCWPRKPTPEQMTAAKWEEST